MPGCGYVCVLDFFVSEALSLNFMFHILFGRPVYFISGYEASANFCGQVCIRRLESATFGSFAVKKLTHRMKLRGLDT